MRSKLAPRFLTSQGFKVLVNQAYLQPVLVVGMHIPSIIYHSRVRDSTVTFLFQLWHSYDCCIYFVIFSRSTWYKLENVAQTSQTFCKCWIRQFHTICNSKVAILMSNQSYPKISNTTIHNTMLSIKNSDKMTSWVPDSDLQELLLTTLPSRHGDGLESSRRSRVPWPKLLDLMVWLSRIQNWTAKRYTVPSYSISQHIRTQMLILVMITQPEVKLRTSFRNSNPICLLRFSFLCLCNPFKPRASIVLESCGDQPICHDSEHWTCLQVAFWNFWALLVLMAFMTKVDPCQFQRQWSCYWGKVGGLNTKTMLCWLWWKMTVFQHVNMVNQS